MSRKILVTGGSGFIGSHLVCNLLERGEWVRVLELPTASKLHLPQNQIDFILGDIRDPSIVRKAVEGCEIIYHLAANPQLWTKRRGTFRKVNYYGSVNVLDAAIRAG